MGTGVFLLTKPAGSNPNPNPNPNTLRFDNLLRRY
jgi:hypothetical protein